MTMLARSSRDKVLLVEFNDGLADLIASGFRRVAGCDHVTRARTGPEAREHIAEAGRDGSPRGGGIRAVVLDMDLPADDGIEVLEKLRSCPVHQGTPVFVLGLFVSRQVERRCRELQCHAFVSKWEALLDLDKFVSQVLEQMHPADPVSETPGVQSAPRILGDCR